MHKYIIYTSRISAIVKFRKKRIWSIDGELNGDCSFGKSVSFACHFDDEHSEEEKSRSAKLRDFRPPSRAVPGSLTLEMTAIELAIAVQGKTRNPLAAICGRLTIQENWHILTFACKGVYAGAWRSW